MQHELMPSLLGAVSHSILSRSGTSEIVDLDETYNGISQVFMPLASVRGRTVIRSNYEDGVLPDGLRLRIVDWRYGDLDRDGKPTIIIAHAIEMDMVDVTPGAAEP